MRMPQIPKKIQGWDTIELVYMMIVAATVIKAGGGRLTERFFAFLDQCLKLFAATVDSWATFLQQHQLVTATLLLAGVFVYARRFERGKQAKTEQTFENVIVSTGPKARHESVS